MKSTEQTRAAAQDVLDWIHANPELHNQENVWGVPQNGCGTTMCIAGSILAQKYGLKTVKDFGHWFEIEHGYTQTPPDYSHSGMLRDSEYDWVREAGTELGLTEQEACELFYTLDNEEAVQKLKHIVVGEPWHDTEAS